MACCKTNIFSPIGYKNLQNRNESVFGRNVGSIHTLNKLVTGCLCTVLCLSGYRILVMPPNSGNIRVNLFTFVALEPCYVASVPLYVSYGKQNYAWWF